EKDCNRKITKEEFKNLPKWIKQKYEKGLPGSFDPANAQVDFRAKIIKIETTPQDDKPLRVLFENGKIMSGYEDTVFTIATLDFLADGGSGYGEFIGIPKVGKIETTVDGEITHVLREVLSESFAKEKKVFHAKIDSRWLVVEPSDDNGRLSRPPTVLPKKPVSPEPLDPEPK
ncbi:hypothetical protein HZA26_04430, partial [Candidatus Nomurabacteria bacterium]|nr:hypothetical protein [Candidatus Nomurabacteria bacterium]